MNTLLSLQKLSKQQMEILSKQPSFSLEQAKQQVERLSTQSASVKKLK